MSVPLDYADPDGEQITIGLNRLPARDPAQRIGSLIFNPGGPGGAASPVVAREASGTPVFTPAVRDHFDIIGMDPRGTGTSTPVRCDPDVWNEDVSRFPRDEAGFAQLRAHTQAVGESCLRLTGPLLGHLDTVSVARDMERVRLALGGEPLNFLGLSYGTQLGATYAQLFPDTIRVMALDGALDHAQRPLAMLDNEARAYETELERFAAWCDATASCALHGQDVLAVYDGLVATADETPIPTPRCAERGICRAGATGEDIRFAVQGYLIFTHPRRRSVSPAGKDWPRNWPRRRPGTPAPSRPTWRKAMPTGSMPGWASSASTGRPILQPTTTSPPTRRSPASLPRTRKGRRRRGRSWSAAWGGRCRSPTRPRVWNVEGTPPILIVNSTYDPSDNYLWAQLMREQIAGSVLLTRIGDGHTSYLLPGESQTRDAIDHYLITGETPPPNTVYES